MFKSNKGLFGYIEKQRKIEILKTVVMLILCIAIYYMGLYSTGSNANLLTFVAVLGCLPMAKFAVNSVMFIRAKGCSEEVHDKLIKEGIKVDFYDLYMTGYKENFPFSCLIYKKASLILLTEDKNTDLSKAEEHVTKILANAGYDKITVKAYIDTDKFILRAKELEKLTVEEKNLDNLYDNLLSVSL